LVLAVAGLVAELANLSSTAGRFGSWWAVTAHGIPRNPPRNPHGIGAGNFVVYKVASSKPRGTLTAKNLKIYEALPFMGPMRE
jgi:hypothetical protein